MTEVRDLRKVHITQLTDQEIKSRLHIINDQIDRVRSEYQELEDMADALTLEQERRKLATEQSQ
ncbi:hypothetical protein [Vibrio phage VCPH]|nr:hypothetical protein [Vibrio phage VCPH]